MNRNTARTIERVKQAARADAKAMGETYARRLDAQAAAIACTDWRTLQEHARAGHEIDPTAMMVARGAIAGRAVHVDAEFAMSIQSGEVEDEEAAYREAFDRSIDVAAVDEAISRPRASDAEADYRLRRDILTRALWKGLGGKDRLVQAVGELVAVLAHLAADPSLHQTMVDAGVLPPLWVGRAPTPYMLRDAMLLSEAYREDPLVPDARSRLERSDRWWNGVRSLIEEHLPLGVSGWLHDIVADGWSCGHDCGHQHHIHHEPQGGRSRDAAVLIAFERLDHVCDAIERPAPPSPEVAAAVRADYEQATRIRYARRLGGTQAQHAEAVTRGVDDFLERNGKTFGDPVWHWDAGMARRFADLALDRLLGADGNA